MITIDQSRCKHCDLCRQACPDGIIARGPMVPDENAPFCISCGHCHAICPEGAITVQGFEGVQTPPLPERPPVSPEAMLDLLRSRRSGRLFRPEPVSREHLQALLHAASLAPSSMNARPVHACVCTDPAALERLRKETARYFRGALKKTSLPVFPLIWKLIGQPREKLAALRHGLQHLLEPGDGRDPILCHAPALIVFTIPRKARESAGDPWLAAQNAVICAETLGLASCYNGVFAYAANRSRAIAAELRIPRGRRIEAALMLGYPRARFAREAPRKEMEITWI